MLTNPNFLFIFSIKTIDRLTNNIKLLEKKLGNLTREIDLKDISIKSQEQMIERRNKEIEDIKQNKVNTGEIKAFQDKIKNLEMENFTRLKSIHFIENQIDMLKKGNFQTSHCSNNTAKYYDEIENESSFNENNISKK